jgi:pyruvate/2-oxoglutarate dehydrogenase complex dihydrolipoamide acyltransferase (E2) component
VRPDGSVTLQVPQSGRSVILKPGQSVELLSGAVEEGYSRRLEAPKPEPKPAAKPAADARSARPAAPDSAAQREREERETQRLEDAISRALVETASARPGAAPSPGAPATQ